MNAQEAEAAYREIRSQLDAGRIVQEEYNRKIAELRYQDNTGTWWAVSPQDGSWLKWDGAAWVPAPGQAAPAAGPQGTAPLPSAQQYPVPPAGSAQQPATPGSQPAAAPAGGQKPAGKMYAGISIVCAIAAIVVSPYVLGIIAIIAGAVALKQKNKYGAIGIVLAVCVILMDYFYLMLF